MTQDKRDKVIDELFAILHSRDKKLLYAIKSALVREGRFTAVEFQSVRGRRASLCSCKTEELCWVAKAIADYDSKYLYLLDYFTQEDISRSNNYYKEVVNANSLLRLPNAFLLSNNQWSAVVSVSQLAQMVSFNLIKPLDEKRVHQIRVREISESISSDKFNYNAIRLNVARDGNGDIPYIDAKGYLVLQGNEITILDGYHRVLGASRAYYKEPANQIFSERFFQVFVTYLSDEDADKVMIQEWNAQTPPIKRRVQMVDKNAISVIDLITANKSANKIYTNSIVNNQKEVIDGKGFIPKPLFIEALNKYFYVTNMTSPLNLKRLAEWLVEYYNLAVTLLSDEFKSYESGDDTSWLTSPWGWYALTCFGSTIYGDPNWKSIATNGIVQINWNDKSIITSVKNDTIINIIKLCKEVCSRNVTPGMEI